MLKELITPTDGWWVTNSSEADICLFLESHTLKTAEIPMDYQKNQFAACKGIWLGTNN